MVVVVFSSSEDPRNICRAYELGANSYVIKPHDPEELVAMVGRLQEYWLSINSTAQNQAGECPEQGNTEILNCFAA